MRRKTRRPPKNRIYLTRILVAGGVTEAEYLGMIPQVGFHEIDIVDRLDYVMPSEEQPCQMASIRVKGIKNMEMGKEDSRMKTSLTALDRETQLLVAAGSAVAAGCISCLETIVGMARADGVDERKLKEAVMTGQYVKEQPANMMKEFADKLLVTHLGGKVLATEGGCPLSREPEEAARHDQDAANVSCGTGGCGCSAPQK